MRARWIAALALLPSAIAGAEQVVRVKDGDSLVVDSGGRQVDVRLADIDAPESRQPRGDEARAALSTLVEGQEVRLQLVAGDAYRRIVAYVFVDDLDVNAEMVQRGLAWVRRDYDPAPRLVRREDEARAAGRGLWADADATPPWQWRRGAGRRRAPALVSVAEATVPQVSCGAKRYCREMASCGEALAFLRQCGVGGMDGDKDGVPCEKTLCGP